MRNGYVGELDDEGHPRITGRMKDIIVTAGGKNVAPAPLEDLVRAHFLVSQSMVVGDGKPYPAALVTIDEEAFPAWKDEHSKPAGATAAELRDDPDLGPRSRPRWTTSTPRSPGPSRSAGFGIVDGDFTQENGQLTPSLKVRRNVVAKDRAADFEALDAGNGHWDAGRFTTADCLTSSIALQGEDSCEMVTNSGYARAAAIAAWLSHRAPRSAAGPARGHRRRRKPRRRGRYPSPRRIASRRPATRVQSHSCSAQASRCGPSLPPAPGRPAVG